MNIPIWPGSSSFQPGETPFGFYDNDPQFQADANKFALFASRRLGYPIVDIELQDLNFYAAFEEAITTYGNELYAYSAQENLLSFQGASTTIGPANNQLIQPNLGAAIRLSDQYGTEAGVGGNVTWYSASIQLQPGVQDYNLTEWALNLGIAEGDLEIKRVFYEATPAIVRYFDPYAGTGTGMMQLLDSFGFGGYSPAVNFLMMPINYDLQKLQAIELNDQIRRSQFSFELINNNLRIFPIPDGRMQTTFLQYIKKSDRNNPYADNGVGSVITNVSNIPYENPNYTQINSIGRQWIFEYALAIVKEILGYVRGKYSNIPIPNAEVTLNQSDLIAAATSERNALIERLRAYFDGTSRQSLMERKTAEGESLNKELGYVPFLIFVG
jgi:hypothetical protein|tara:strand:+ start:2104 stop:3255 length:1152 start_codon:yes stop_codon:yes gene_type:complete